MKGGDGMSKALKLIAPILAAIILLTFFMSLLFVIHEAHHNCTGEDCPICARIEACISTVKNFVDLVTVALLLDPCPLICLILASGAARHLPAHLLDTRQRRRGTTACSSA